MVRSTREGPDLDSEDIHVGRMVITKGLVPPGAVLDALEDKAWAAERGKRVTLAEILVKSGKITKRAVEELKGLPRSPSTIEAVAKARHMPTMKLVDGWWRETQESSQAQPSSEIPPLLAIGQTEHQVTLDFGRPDESPEEAKAAPEVEGEEIDAAEVESEPSSKDELIIVDTDPPKPGGPAGVPRKGARMGPWLLDDELGRGGMGVIFRARHDSWGEVAAVKVLRDPTRRSLLDRFTRETEAVRRLEHPNIVRILDHGQEGHCPWFAMELVIGKTLSKLIRGKELLPRQAVEILRTVARAVHHAHELGVVHRDLKPANVIIANDGTVKVTDFGLAKVDGDERCLTRPGAPIGTPAYMSPEQAVGGAVDRTTDVFSLGVMLYEAVSGKLPWTPERLAHVYAGGKVVLPPMKRGDAALEAIVARATEARPDARFASAEAFAKELDAWLEGSVPSTSRLRARLSRIKKLPRSVELTIAAICGGFFVSALSVRVAESRLPVPVVAREAGEGKAALPLPREAGEGRGGGATAPAVVKTPAPVAAPVPVPAAVPVPAPVPVAAPVPVPAPVPVAAPAPAPAPVSATECAKKLIERTELVPVSAPADVASSVSSDDEDPRRAEEAELARVKAGRKRLLAVLQQLDGFDSFDETALAVRLKRGSKVPLANVAPGFILGRVPAGEERANIGRYLRARGLAALAERVER